MLSRALMEVKRMWPQFHVVAGAAALALSVAGCSRPTAAPNPPQSRYLAGSVCAACHSEIAKSYRKTGMGRSFYRPSATNVVEDYAKHNQLYHRASDRYYAMIERNG